jgi:hypothetical protein
MKALRKLLTLVSILLLIGAAYINLLAIYEANTTNNKDTVVTYTVSANIINGLGVLCLVVLTINSIEFSSFYKAFVILILLGGLIAELYFIGTELYSRNYQTYIALILNLLIRVYYLIYYFNDAWAMFPSVGTTNIIQRTIIQPQKTIERTILPPAAERVMDEDSEIFRNQFKTIFRQAREKVGRDNFDNSTIDKAYKEVIDPAVAARDFSRDRLKDAAGYLKDKTGNSIKDLVFGGKKRR